MKKVNFREYITEVLKNAAYEKGESSDVIIAEAPDLPGCFTQGKNFEETRENLIDAIELWITVGLKKGEEMPIVNGCRLAADAEAPTKKKAYA
jgi:predicted RNase H-like HicB family nuclease